ncbi:MAG: hypothetical protein JST16_18425 [Bdellovibrionales bacterium]|nr:hypothetical protein [Bdellovibrionales bacterium]
MKKFLAGVSKSNFLFFACLFFGPQLSWILQHPQNPSDWLPRTLGTLGLSALCTFLVSQTEGNATQAILHRCRWAVLSFPLLCVGIDCLAPGWIHLPLNAFLFLWLANALFPVTLNNLVRHPNRTILFCFVSILLLVHAPMLSLFLKIGFQLFLIFMPGASVLSLLAPNAHEAYFFLAPAITFLVYGGIYVLLFSLGLPPLAFCVVLTLFTVGLAGARWRIRRPSLDTLVPPKFRFPLLATLFLSFISIVFIFAAEGKTDLALSSLPANLYAGLGSLPIDNLLPLRTADSLLSLGAPWADGGWTMGDRPPLMGAWVAISTFITLGLGKLSPTFFLTVGILLNSLFVFPLFEICRRLAPKSPFANLLPVALYLAPFVFLNTFFTWPKSLGAFFVLSLIAFYANISPAERSQKKVALLMGGVMALGSLSHGAATLSLPLLGLAYFIFTLREMRSWRAILPPLCFLLAMFSAGLPWSTYKKAHPEIDTFRLLGHYCDWVEDKEPATYATSEMRRQFISFHRQTSLSQQWEKRTQQVLSVAKSFVMTPEDFSMRQIFGHKNQRSFSNDFFGIKMQFGALYWCCAFLVIAGLVVSRSFRWHKHGFASGILLASLASLTLNIFLKWRTYVPHEGPYAELVLIKASLLALVLNLGWIPAVFIATESLWTFANYIFSGTQKVGLTPFSCDYLVLWVALSAVLFRSILTFFESPAAKRGLS